MDSETGCSDIASWNCLTELLCSSSSSDLGTGRKQGDSEVHHTVRKMNGEKINDFQNS
jgi:hypothetical protein